jgi:hypothetical protein
MMKNLYFKALLSIVCISAVGSVLAQNTDKQDKVKFFTGAATVTTKGLSTFPNLTLGKPAAILDLSMGGNKFRFEPIFRFALEGKPWSFIFWCRYELLNNEKFQFKIGAHPAYSFKTITVTQNGTVKDILRAQQYIAGELAPVFKVGKNINLGPYYIYARGLEKDIVRNSNFISFRVNFSSINLTDKFFMRLMAQTYYLKLDDLDGAYVNSTLSLNRRNFPLSVSSTMNKTIQSKIPGNNFLWNINLTYVLSGI